jgi:hypothetical protein
MTFAKHPNLFAGFKTWIAVGFSSLIVLGITACGGGGSPSTPGNPSASSITAGAYIGTVSGKDWVSILLPTESTAAGVTHFYALHYNSANPDIYSGAGKITGTNSADLTSLSLFPNIAATLRTGTGTLSSPSSGVVRAKLSIDPTASDIALNINLDHSAPAGYSYNTSASLTSVKEVWQGRWSYGVGFVDNFPINISDLGDVTSSSTFQNDCRLTNSKLTPSLDGSNLYSWTATIPNATQCSLKNQTLTGAAFVIPIYEPGKTQRLYLVGVTTDGRGISFKADR